MAQNIRLRHAQSGVITTGFYGFSWTTLFFSGFPAIFRGDLITGVIVLILSASSFWLVAIIWAFLYNRVYTTRLLERGCVLSTIRRKLREAKRCPAHSRNKRMPLSPPSPRPALSSPAFPEAAGKRSSRSASPGP